MRNEEYINELLDEYVEQKRTFEDVLLLLQQHGVENASEEINLHHAAAVALQRYSILQQVNNVHNGFLQNSDSESAFNGDSSKVISIRKPLQWIIRVAAVFLIVTTVLFTYTILSTNTKRVYADIYQPYDVNVDRAAFEEIVPHNMVSRFKEKNYAAVIETYQGLTVTNNREKFLTAIAFQETSNHQQAINLFKQILEFNQQQNSRLYNDEAEFYLGLNFLKTNNHKEAIPLFEKILNDPNHTYHERINKTTLWKIKWLDK